MAADVNIGSPTRHPGSDFDEIHNFDPLSAEADQTPYPPAAKPSREPGYRTGYRDGYRDASTATKDHDADTEKPGETAPEPPKSFLRRALPYAIAALVTILLIVAVVVYWLRARHYETTDDAFIDAHVANISSQVAGRVIEVQFDDNQQVGTGQTLIRIDPADYQKKVDRAKASLGSSTAQLAQARAQLLLQKANLQQATAQVTVAEAELQQANQDLARYRGVDPRAVTRQDVDKTSATARTAQAKLEANRAAEGGAKAQIEAAEAQVKAAEAGVSEQQVAVANAELQLSYTNIVAPIDGRVAKRNVELGTYVSPGQALVAIVPNAMWVTANFKETQLTDMRLGDPVDIEIDAYPKTTFHGRVDSFQTGTGSAFSTLPAENATGNYVKVVQRLPVKIIFDDDRIKDVRLAPGLSVQPSVKVR